MPRRYGDLPVVPLVQGAGTQIGCRMSAEAILIHGTAISQISRPQAVSIVKGNEVARRCPVHVILDTIATDDRITADAIQIVIAIRSGTGHGEHGLQDVDTGQCPIDGIRCAVLVFTGDAAPRFPDMPDPLIAGVPGTGGFLLVGGAGVSVVQVKDRIGCAAQQGNLHPRHQFAGGTGVFLTLVRDPGDTITCGEEDIVSAALGVSSQISIREFHENGEVNLISRTHLIVINGDDLPECGLRKRHHR